MNTRTRFCALWLGAAAIISGCGPEAGAPEPSDTAAEAPVGEGMSEAGVLVGAGPWTVEATHGAEVTLDLNGPLVAGSFSVAVTVSDANDEVVAHSLDLLSPTMPMHGLVRVPVVDAVGEIEIPMEGRWALYVNLDAAGEDHAQFVFDVEPATNAGHEPSGGH